MNRRNQIQLTPEDQAKFLQEQQKCALATLDKNGFPHMVAMNYAAKDGVIYMTSYGKAQKVVNVRRNPKVGVMVEAGKRFFLLRAVNVSGRGAKVMPMERLGEGSIAQLHFHPPDGSSLDVEAIVWRVDRDGLAFFFTDDHQRRLAALLAQLAGAPPALGASTLN